jgi:metal-sulfur cluster biosynthetic enzyme
MVSQPQREPSGATNAEPITIAAVWLWLDEVLDPEIPVISVVDL